MRLITNNNTNKKPNDRLKLNILAEAKHSSVHIATAFFTESEVLESIVNQDCSVMLIVRLGTGTSPTALEKAINLPNVMIRFFNDQHFHPKFYIFDRNIAFLGSGNFTYNGLMRNQEVMIEIRDEETLADLDQVFIDYWDQAEILTENYIKQFKAFQMENPAQDENLRAKKLANEMGSFIYDNAGVDQPKKSSIQIFVSEFQKRYQLFLNAYKQLSDIYSEFGQRKWDSVPLRIEVNRYLSWLRDEDAKGNSFKTQEKLTQEEIARAVRTHIPDFMNATGEWLEHKTINCFTNINQKFASKKLLMQLNDKEIADILAVSVFSFHDYLRFTLGGLEAHKKSFITSNPDGKIKKSLSYLLFGSEDYQERIARCVLDPEYKLHLFGESSVTELFGLVNKDEIPIRNGRVIITMQWLGFGKV